MTIFTLILLLLTIGSQVHAGTFPQGYAVKAGTTLWSAAGAGPNNGLASLSTGTSGTASCGTPATVTQAQIDNSVFPGTAPVAIPGSGSFIRVIMSGGGSGGDCVVYLDVADFNPQPGLYGQFMFFAPGYNSNPNVLVVKMEDLGGVNRLSLNVNATTGYVYRQEGWNLVQAYCDTALTYPDWAVETGSPTCSGTGPTMQYWTMRATIAANTTITMYFGDVIKGYYAKPQVVVWSADGDNTAVIEMLPYMSARGMAGSYAPTSGEINAGPNPMSLANLLSLRTAGWSIHPHQSSSVIGLYTNLSLSALASELELVKSQFASQGIPMSLFYVPPGGVCTTAQLATYVASGFSGLGCDGNVSAYASGRPIYGGYISWANRWNIIAEGLTFAQNRDIIDHAIKYGETVDLLWHKVDGTVTCNVACFKQVIDYLYVHREAGMLDVVTWDQLVSRQMNPRWAR